MANLKVYGGPTLRGAKFLARRGHAVEGAGPRQVRTLVAARNQREAAAALGMKLHEFRDYWSPTGNADEIAAAIGSPGTIFYASDQWGSDFQVAEKERK